MQNSTTEVAGTKPRNQVRSRRILWWLLALCLLTLLFWLPVRVGLAGYQCYRSARQLATQLRAIDNPASLPELLPQVKMLRGDLAHLQNTLTPLIPVLSHMAFLPGYGPLLAASDRIVGVAEDGAALLDEGIGVVQSAGLPDNGDIGAWVALGPTLIPLHEDLVALEAEIAALPLSDAGGAGAQLLTNFHGALELATVATELGNDWSQLLGATRSATYLVLVQNNHELRATGGFISAIAPLTVVKGELQKIEFADSYTIYSSDLTYPPAPQPMRDFMGIQLLTLRDANWSPNLPAAATLIRSLYQQHTGLAVDGIITVDLDAVALLLPAFEHLTLPGTTVAITQENVEAAMVALWNSPVENANPQAGKDDWWSQRKDFMGQLTGAAFARVEQHSFDPLTLAGGVVKALDRRSIQIWLFDAAAQPALVERGWDGGLHPHANADYLALVDSNLGFNKVNAVVTRALDYHVEWPKDPTLGAEATLTISYTHPVNRIDPVCKPVSYYGTTYEDMIARCYFDYSRVYAPAGSVLLSADGWLDKTVTSTRSEAGTQQFAGYFVLNPGTSHQVTLHYRLPPAIRPQSYQLWVQRQAGTDPLTVHLQIERDEYTTTVVNGQMSWQPSQ